MRTILLKDGAAVPKLGQGTWFLGDDPDRRESEREALRTGIESGMTLIDSAEMYGGGRAESLVGEVVPEVDRSSLFLVSKVLPYRAGKDEIFDACESSISRMKAGYLDLYLLHWRGSVPLRETVECMEELVRRGKIRRWGVSNFDIDDMEELFAVPGGENCAVDQVLYHLGSRGVEYSLLPWLREHQTPLMAYCPLAQGGSLRRGLVTDPSVRRIAEARGASPLQILLAFLLSRENVFAIPRSGDPDHTRENAAAGEIVLTDEETKLLDRAFPAPKRKVWLDIL